MNVWKTLRGFPFGGPDNFSNILNFVFFSMPATSKKTADMHLMVMNPWDRSSVTNHQLNKQKVLGYVTHQEI